MRKILEKIFLDEIKGYKKTVCVSCGCKTNLNEPPFISIAVLRAYGTCVCSNCVNTATNDLIYPGLRLRKFKITIKNGEFTRGLL
jgi:hypothetical protein